MTSGTIIERMHLSLRPVDRSTDLGGGGDLGLRFELRSGFLFIFSEIKIFMFSQAIRLTNTNTYYLCARYHCFHLISKILNCHTVQDLLFY